MLTFLDKLRAYWAQLYEFGLLTELKAVLGALIALAVGKVVSQRTVKTRMGVFLTRWGTHDSRYLTYAHEIRQKHFIKHENFDVFIDVGACLGEYAIWLGRRGYRCLAFEPVLENFEMMRKNILLNNLFDKVQPFGFALGSANMFEHFEVDEVNFASAARVPNQTAYSRKMEVKTLDSLLPDLALPLETRILMKIDVNGMEADILTGAQKFIRLYPHLTIIIEHSDDGLRKNLLELGNFKFGYIDKHGFFARKAQKQQNKVTNQKQSKTK